MTDEEQRYRLDYNTAISRYGTEDDIEWESQDGKTYTLGTMADSHLANAKAYFQRQGKRASDQHQMLDDHLRENPFDPSVQLLRAQMDGLSEAVSNNGRVVYFMTRQIEKRKQMERPSKHNLTLVDKLCKMRERKLVIQGEEDHR